MDHLEPVPVLTTTHPNQAEIVKAALEAEGIPAEVEGENQGGFAGVLSVRVFVRAADADRARAFLAEHGELGGTAEEST